MYIKKPNNFFKINVTKNVLLKLKNELMHLKVFNKIQNINHLFELVNV